MSNKNTIIVWASCFLRVTS